MVCGEPKSMEEQQGAVTDMLQVVDDTEEASEIPADLNAMGSHLLTEPPINVESEELPVKSTIVQICGFPVNYATEKILRLCSTYGHVQHCQKGVIHGQELKPHAAYVTYDTLEEAENAVIHLRGYETEDGTALSVQFCEEQDCPQDSAAQPNDNFAHSSEQQNRFPLQILVPSGMVGAIIGRGGATVRQITQQSKARVDIHRKEDAGNGDKVITISGSSDSCSLACEKILMVIQEEATSQERGGVPLRILAQNSLIGRIIGKGGATIKRIMEQSDTKITVSSVGQYEVNRIITVMGTVRNVCKAEKLVSKKLRQSLENDMASNATPMYRAYNQQNMPNMNAPVSYSYPPGAAGFAPPHYAFGIQQQPLYMVQNQYHAVDQLKETVTVYIPDGIVGSIIGTGGCVIREMIHSSNASIKVERPDPGNTGTDTSRKVIIHGDAEAQFKAQFSLFRKIGNENEACLKVEITVPTCEVGRIIGKGGTTIRNFQVGSRTAIQIPTERGANVGEETKVHITGNFRNVQAAQAMIRNFLHSDRNATRFFKRGPTPHLSDEKEEN